MFSARFLREPPLEFYCFACLKKIFLETKRIQMSIKRYFQNFVDSGVYLTVGFETIGGMKVLAVKGIEKLGNL
jgi:hypothetical protein